MGFRRGMQSWASGTLERRPVTGVDETNNIRANSAHGHGPGSLDSSTQYTHILCIMATKTISLRVEAYDKLRRARTHSRESFSDVVMRARWDAQTVTGGELLALVRERGPLYGCDELDAIDEMKSTGTPPAEKW